MKNLKKNCNNKDMDKYLTKELDTIKNVCFGYKKNKSLNTQLFFTVISAIILYCQQYILKNEIDIGLSNLLIHYIGIIAILATLFGWFSYYLEFHTNDFKYYKIGKSIIWIIELIMILIFIFLLFK